MSRTIGENWLGNMKGYKAKKIVTNQTKLFRNVFFKVHIEQYEEKILDEYEKHIIKVYVPRTEDEDADVETAKKLTKDRLRFERIRKSPRN